MKKPVKLNMQALPAKLRRIMQSETDRGREAYLFGVPVLDMLFRARSLDTDSMNLSAEHSDAWLTWLITDDPDLPSVPLRRNLKSSVPDMPVQALKLCCDARGNLVDPYRVLPSVMNGAILPERDPDRTLAPALAAAALASRYPFRPGSWIQKESPAQAMPSHTELQYWLDALLSGRAADKVLLRNRNLMCRVVPPLRDCIDCRGSRNRHVFDVYSHMAHSVSACRSQDPAIRLALLLHDVGKPMARLQNQAGARHGIYGRDIVAQFMYERYYDLDFRDEVTTLILYHDKPISPNEESIAFWRSRIGFEGLRKLMEVKRADILTHNPDIVPLLMSQWEETRAYLTRQYITIEPDSRYAPKGA